MDASVRVLDLRELIGDVVRVVRHALRAVLARLAAQRVVAVAHRAPARVRQRCDHVVVIRELDIAPVHVRHLREIPRAVARVRDGVPVAVHQARQAEHVRRVVQRERPRRSVLVALDERRRQAVRERRRGQRLVDADRRRVRRHRRGRNGHVEERQDLTARLRPGDGGR